MFDAEIKRINNEILALKQQKEKYAQVMKTMSTSVLLHFDLELSYSQWGWTTVRSNKMAIVNIDAGDNNPLIGVQYNVTGLNSRIIRDVAIYDEADDSIGRMIYVFSQNNSDLQTLSGGGSVGLDYEMIITSTAAVSVTVEYENLWVS